jgi:hypothetical protein
VEHLLESAECPRQSLSAKEDLRSGAMAKRVAAKYLMPTHLIPPVGAERQGPWKVPGGTLTVADYRKAVEDTALLEALSWAPTSRASDFQRSECTGRPLSTS